MATNRTVHSTAAVVAGILYVCCATAPTFAASPVAIDKIVLTGDVAPGTGGLTYWRPEATTINGSGQPPYFQSFLRNGTTLVGGSGLWTGAPRTLLAQPGDAAPGTAAGVTFQSFFTTSVTPAGYVAIDGTLTGPGVTSDVNDRGLWRSSGGPLTLLARADQTAPGIGGSVKFLSVGPAISNDLGATVFRAYLDGGGVNGGNDSGIWHATAAAAPTLVARAGNAAPGLAGVDYGVMGLPRLSGAGIVAFQAGLAGGSVTAANDQAVFAGAPGAFSPILRKGDAAPGTPAGTTFASLIEESVLVNNNGKVAVQAALAGPTIVTDQNQVGIWSNASGSMQLVARAGQHPPGFAKAFKWVTPTDFAVDGSVALVGSFNPAWDSVKDEGVWRSIGAGSTLDDLAVTGQAAPGAGGEAFWDFDHVRLNNSGLIAFTASTRGPGLFDPQHWGIWATMANGTVVKIARVGDAFDVGGGDLRVVDDLTFASTAAGSPLSDNGKLLFTLSFADGSDGVFVADLVPEPGAAALLTLATGSSVLRRRRRNHS